MPKHLILTGALSRKDGGLYITLAPAEQQPALLTVALPNAKPDDLKGLKGQPCPPLRFLDGADKKGELTVMHAEFAAAPVGEQTAPSATAPDLAALASRIDTRRQQALAFLDLAIRTESVPLPAKKPERLEALKLEFQKVLEEMP